MDILDKSTLFGPDPMELVPSCALELSLGTGNDHWLGLAGENVELWPGLDTAARDTGGVPCCGA